MADMRHFVLHRSHGHYFYTPAELAQKLYDTIAAAV